MVEMNIETSKIVQVEIEVLHAPLGHIFRQSVTMTKTNRQLEIFSEKIIWFLMDLLKRCKLQSTDDGG